MSACRPKVVRRGIWSRAQQVKYPDLIKLPSPFEKFRSFKPHYNTIIPKMDNLMNMEYLRMWTEQRDAYMVKRGAIYVPPKKQYPIYRKPVKKPEEAKTIAPTKKYAHIKPKVKTYLPTGKSASK